MRISVLAAAVLWVMAGLSAAFAQGAAGTTSHTAHTLGLPGAGAVDYVFVEKGARRLSLWSNGWLVRTYAIKLGGNPVGDKVQEGDGRTPEGLYSIAYRNPQSRFHLSLMTSYPDERDKAQAASMGVSPGGAIAIHGLPNDEDKAAMGRVHKYVDWTDGCIAVTDREIEEIFALVEPGTAIEIIP